MCRALNIPLTNKLFTGPNRFDAPLDILSISNLHNGYCPVLYLHYARQYRILEKYRRVVFGTNNEDYGIL